jgi:hypothetical protein
VIDPSWLFFDAMYWSVTAMLVALLFAGAVAMFFWAASALSDHLVKRDERQFTCMRSTQVSWRALARHPRVAWMLLKLWWRS